MQPTGWLDTPGDGAALPQVVAGLGSTGAVLARIAGSLSMITAAEGVEPTRRNQRGAKPARWAARQGEDRAEFQRDIMLQIENDGKDSPQLPLDIRRALEDLSMADYGWTDRWGQT